MTSKILACSDSKSNGSDIDIQRLAEVSNMNVERKYSQIVLAWTDQLD